MHYISKNGIFEVVIIYNSQANDIKWDSLSISIPIR